MTTNNLDFLINVWSLLKERGINTWVFGGWAEEILKVASPRCHRDIDLLYPSSDFNLLDRVLAAYQDMDEIMEKRFSHKRAFVLDGVMVEVILVERHSDGFETSFFNGAAVYRWPDDIFDGRVELNGVCVDVSSPGAVIGYRNAYASIRQTIQAHANKLIEAS